MINDCCLLEVQSSRLEGGGMSWVVELVVYCSTYYDCTRDLLLVM